MKNWFSIPVKIIAKRPVPDTHKLFSGHDPLDYIHKS